MHTVGGFGYRRLHDLIRPEFVPVNHKRIERMYREAHLAVHRRRKAKRPRSERQPLQAATMPNAVWSMDFVSDALASGRRLKCLTVQCASLIATGPALSGEWTNAR